MKTLASFVVGTLTLFPALATGQMAAAPAVGPQAAHQIGTPTTANAGVIRPVLRAAMHEESVGNIPAAVTNYQTAIRQNPLERRAYIHYARMLHRLGDMSGSVSIYRAWLRQSPQDALALNDLGLCFLRFGHVMEATECFQAAVMNKPASDRYCNNLAIALVQAGRRDEALSMLEERFGAQRANEAMAGIFAMRNEPELAEKHQEVAASYDASKDSIGTVKDPVVELVTETQTTPTEEPASDLGLLGDVAPVPFVVQPLEEKPQLNMAPATNHSPQAAGWNFIRRQAEQANN